MPPSPATVSPTLPATGGTRAARARRTSVLVAELAAARDDASRRSAQDRLAECNLPVALAVAARYRSRGVSREDLEQVACLALVKAVRRFDPGAGHDFLSFCVPTVRGEVRRYFRDQAWVIRPPRRIQELQGAIGAVESTLASELGRTPTPEQVASRLDASPSEVREAMGLKGAFTPTSLDQPASTNGATSLGDLLGETDAEQGRAEARVTLATAVQKLAERDRHILQMRFVHDRTQREIAEDIGVTQMQVSRLLTRILADLRALLGDPDPASMVA